jgi:hypothetical protein
VDLTAYTSPLRPSEPAAAVVPPRPAIMRRPALEMPVAPPKAMAVGQTGDVALEAPAEAGEFDLNLELDVPAFLRRNEG